MRSSPKLRSAIGREPFFEAVEVDEKPATDAHHGAGRSQSVRVPVEEQPSQAHFCEDLARLSGELRHRSESRQYDAILFVRAHDAAAAGFSTHALAGMPNSRSIEAQLALGGITRPFSMSIQIRRSIPHRSAASIWVTPSRSLWTLRASWVVRFGTIMPSKMAQTYRSVNPIVLDCRND